MSEKISKVKNVSTKLVPQESWAALAILWTMFALNANGIFCIRHY